MKLEAVIDAYVVSLPIQVVGINQLNSIETHADRAATDSYPSSCPLYLSSLPDKIDSMMTEMTVWPADAMPCRDDLPEAQPHVYRLLRSYSACHHSFVPCSFRNFTAAGGGQAAVRCRLPLLVIGARICVCRNPTRGDH